MADFSFTIPGEVSGKKNENMFSMRTGRVFKSDRFRSWHSMAYMHMRAQARPERPIETPVNVDVAFVHGDNRRRDGDNGLSAIMDLLVDTKILADDRWSIVRNIRVSNDYEKGKPSCRIRITDAALP